MRQYFNRVTLYTNAGRAKNSFPYLREPRKPEMFNYKSDAETKAREIQGFMDDCDIKGTVETVEGRS